MGDDRGQLQTLEGFAASLLIVLSLLFAVQATSVTPLTSSTANVHVEAQLQFMADDILRGLEFSPSDSLRDNLLQWDGQVYVWNGTAYVDESNSSHVLAVPLARSLNSTLVRNSIAHNLELFYIDSSTGKLTNRKIIWNGNPSQNAVSVQRVVVMNDCDALSSVGEGVTCAQDYANNTFWNTLGIGDLDPSSLFYNVLAAKLTLWRM